MALEGGAELPLLDTVVVDLQACRKEKNLLHAKHALIQIHKHGLETHLALANYLVPLFVECGSLSDAQQVFNRLPHPNEHLWTALIRGYTQYGEHQNALSLFKQMQEVCVLPSSYTFLPLLKACGQLRWAEEGQAFHLDIVKYGFEQESFVSNQVMDMYAKCGAFAEAHMVFDGLGSQDATLWTALIVRYVEHGLSEEALSCLEQMQQQGVSPNDVTLVCSLKACSSLGAVDKGKAIHAQIILEGYEEDTFIGNTLVDFYANSGLLLEAHEVFDELSTRDVVSWTALISGYAEQGFAQESLRCLDEMFLEGMIPNSITYFSSLKACTIMRAIGRGKILHIEITKAGLEQDYLVSSTLVDLYSKGGLLIEAQAVFDELRVRNVVLWTALITGYAEHGLAKEALSCFSQMQSEGIDADAATFVCVLKVCSSIGSTDRGLNIHLHVIKDGYEQNVYVGSTLVDMYARCGLLTEARAVLVEMPVQCVVSWTALMDGYADHGFGKEALSCLSEMQSESLSPNAFTFVCALKASMVVGSICEGQALHTGIVKCGVEKDTFIGCTLVDMYSKCGLLTEAQESFDALPIRDAALWNSMITGYVECNHIEQAISYTKRMQVEGVCPNTMTWNALLLGFTEHEEITETLQLYMQMLEQAVLPDGLTYVIAIKACGNLAAVEIGKVFHAQVENLSGPGFDEAGEMIIVTALVDMYSKCGSMRDAQLVFDGMPNRDLIAWATLISGYARRGGSESIFDLLGKMKDEGVKPDEYTFFNVLSACSHAGQVDKGIMFFEVMSTQCGIFPDVIHQNCMVDILSRAGQLNEALMLMTETSFLPNIVTWNTLLAACQYRGDIDIGQHAFEHAAYLDEEGAAFILMSNMYVDNYVLDDVRRLEPITSTLLSS